MKKLRKSWLLQGEAPKKINRAGLVLLALLSVISYGRCQINLVGNPSFEVFNTPCPPANYISKLKYWNSIDSVQLSAAGLTYNICYPLIPNTGVGYQWPKTGGGLIRLQVYCTSVTCTYTNSRLYPKNRLLTSLTAGNTYCVKMYVSLQNTSAYAIDALQVLLADPSIDTIKYCKVPLTYLNPQITNTLGIISDTLNWIKIENTFTASGNEKYLVLGNFKTDLATNAIPTGFNSGVWSEYFIDDVSVIDYNLPAYAGPDKNINLGDSTFIGRPPEIGLECTWTSGTSTVGTGGGIWVKPMTIGTFSYVVTQNICGNIKTDTVNVNISSGLKSESEVFAESISVYPQPARDVVTISLQHFYDPFIQISICDLTGKLVRSSEFVVRSGKAELSTHEFQNGVYILRISSKQQTVSKRLVVAR